MHLSEQVVLLGEPDLPTSELYQRVLGVVFTVLVAPDENTIALALRTHSIAALVLEPAMFVEDSWRHLAAMSDVCAERSIPLIICSTLDAQRRAMELGLAAYLVKPTLPTTLLDTVQRVISSEKHTLWMQSNRPH